MVHQSTEGLSFERRAHVLAEALPWLRHHHGKIVVVKHGGSATTDLKLKRAFVRDTVSLHTMGAKPVVVHGGGPQILSMLKRLELEGESRGGFRITTLEAMEVVRMVLFGQVGHELVNLINTYGLYTVGTSGEDGDLFIGTQCTVDVDGEGTDTGLVGNVTKAYSETLLDLIDTGRVPAVSTVAPSVDGKGVYSINADAAAGVLASAINANRLVILINVEGLYADWPNHDSLVSKISAPHLREILPALDSGMIPKIESCLSAVDQGVPAAHVIDGRQSHPMLLELMTSSGIGTMVEPGQDRKD